MPRGPHLRRAQPPKQLVERRRDLLQIRERRGDAPLLVELAGLAEQLGQRQVRIGAVRIVGDEPLVGGDGPLARVGPDHVVDVRQRLDPLEIVGRQRRRRLVGLHRQRAIEEPAQRQIAETPPQAQAQLARRGRRQAIERGAQRLGEARPVAHPLAQRGQLLERLGVAGRVLQAALQKLGGLGGLVERLERKPGGLVVGGGTGNRIGLDARAGAQHLNRGFEPRGPRVDRQQLLDDRAPRRIGHQRAPVGGLGARPVGEPLEARVADLLPPRAALGGGDPGGQRLAPAHPGVPVAAQGMQRRQRLERLGVLGVDLPGLPTLGGWLVQFASWHWIF